MKSKGLGDSKEKLTKATGIAKIVEKVNPDCGCGKRKRQVKQNVSHINEKNLAMAYGFRHKRSWRGFR